MELDLIGMEDFHFLAIDQAGMEFFGVDMSSSTKIDNREKDILILDKGPTQGLEHTPSVKKMYSINFTEHSKKFVS